MNYILDICFIAVIAVILVRSAKRGFVLSALEFAFSLLGTAVSWTLAAMFCDEVYARFVKEKLMTYLNNTLLPGLENIASTDINAVLNAIPKPLLSAGQSLGLITSDSLSVDLSGALTAEKLESAFLGPIAIFAVKALLFVVLALVLGVLLRLVAHGVSRLVKASPLKIVNTLLGGLFGLLKGGLIVLVVALAVTSISYAIPNSEIAQAIDQSKICGFAVDILNLI